jgi:TetR/AcrR family transcriptional repressor of nem operon
VSDGKRKSRQIAKQETREALIRAGMSLFSEEGVDLPSLDSICARAGFTRGAFYVHFRHRDDFLEAVMDRALVDFINTVVAVSQSSDDLNDTIGRFLSAVAKGKVPLMGTQQRLMAHLMTRGVQRADKMRARAKFLLGEALARLASAAENAQRAGTVKAAVDPDLLAAWLVAAALGLVTLLNFGIEIDLTRIQASARELLRIEPR